MRQIAFISVVLLLGCSSRSESQIIQDFGVRLGLTSSHHLIQSTEGSQIATGSRSGYIIGGFIEFLNYKNVRLSTEINFTRKGSYLTVSDTNRNSEKTEEIKTTIDYLSLPVLVKLRFPTKTFSPYVCIGPRIDILLRYDENGLKGLYDYINKVDFGISLGGGTEITLGRKYFFAAEMRYSPDLTPYSVWGYQRGAVYSIYADGANYTNRCLEFLFGAAIKLQ